MHLNAQRPVFVPEAYQREMEKLSKAALMDIAWDYAQRCAGGSIDPETIMNEFRANADIIIMHRANARD